MNIEPTGDFPQISAFSYGSTTLPTWDNQMLMAPDQQFQHRKTAIERIDHWPKDNDLAAYIGIHPPITQSKPMPEQTRRIAQVFIADPHPDVPLTEALLYQTEPKFTDASDQELYFESPVMEKLKAHNEKRIKWLDKEATKRAGKDVFLDPIKVRDLRMVVVTIASF